MPDAGHAAPPHWPAIDGLVRRTTRDQQPDALLPRISGRAVLQPQQPVIRRPRLVSSAHGRIGALFLTIPSYAVHELDGRPNPLSQVYRDLLQSLPATTEYTVLAHDSVADTVRTWVPNAHDLVVGVPDHLHFSVWAEDGFVSAEDAGSGQTVLIEPFAFPRYADALVADTAANASPQLRHTQAPLYFQGGNVLVGDDFFFIGADYPAESIEQYVGRVVVPRVDESPAQAVHRLYGEYLDQTRRLLYVGSSVPVPEQQVRAIEVDGQIWSEVVHTGNKPGTVQPLFHIDMFVTLAGRDADDRYHLLVGDPRAAAEVLGIAPWDHAMQHVFDDIAAGLERLGFVVHRNPLPMAFVDDPEQCVRTWYFATANNALVEIDEASDHRRVWLPSYGFGNWPELQATDRANARVWADLGFEVTALGDFHPFAASLGAVHCITKYLRRD